ncbi:unnamed protein product [Periconia digitata]|uniref:Early meiotic induction protein 1 n=1 Tax=Periconia digitata TaxID=1303443 RepID=A0A9W4U609_9PLEO|nr:unnamed protein product [Periconia digitata]
MAWGWWTSSPSGETKPESQPQQLQPIPQTSQPPSPPASTTPSQPPKDSNDNTSNNNDDFNTAFPHLAPPPPSTEPTTPHDPLLPSTMSCRDAFDSAFYCSSFGGHFNDIYRFGQLRSCSEHWADWRFCMGIKTMSAEGKVQAIQDRYRKKEEKIKAGPNSEDVWSVRGEGEKVEKPFGRASEW